jgi:hypothetical protein
MRMRLPGACVLLGLVLAACDHGSGGGPKPPAVAAPAVPRALSFRVVYRVEDTAGPQQMIATDVVQVGEPWSGLLEHRDGPPPGGAVLSATIQNQRFTFNTSQGSVGFSTRRIPGALNQAPSPESLQAAAAAGLVERIGDATVAGEPCTNWTFKASNEVLAKGTAEEHTESCITADGVPLREAITLQGKLVRVAEAVQVDRHPPVTPDTFQSQRDPSKEGNGLLESDQLVDEGAKTGKTIVKVTPPVGFNVTRQVSVTRQAGENSAPVASYVQGFESGADLVTTEQVTTPGNPPWSAGEGQPVDLGSEQLSGRIVYRLGWAEVRVTVGGSTSVRVSSPRPALALAVAKALRKA